MAVSGEFTESVLAFIESHPDGVTEGEMAGAFGTGDLAGALSALAGRGAAERRETAGIPTWYPVLGGGIKNVLIVEDDENINNLMKASLGKGFQFTQAFDGNEALAKLAAAKPDLVLLDLMMPGPDGIEVCRRIKSDPKTRDVIVVIVSAADERRNRFVSLKEGADYYIKKPFEPSALRSLVNIFLRKIGRRFDPLVDLPDAERLAAEVKRAVEGAEDFEVTNLRIGELDGFRRDFGEQEAAAVLRLVSQIMQDKVNEWGAHKVFAGYLGEGEFVLCGGKNGVSVVLSEVNAEFDRVQPFIRQSTEIKGVARAGLARMDLYELLATGGGGKPGGRQVSLTAEAIPTSRILARTAAINERDAKTDLGQYSMAELKELLGSSTRMDFTISSTPSGIKLSMSQGAQADDGKGQ